MFKKKMNAGELIGIVSALLLMIASFLPWATVSVLGVSETILGIEGDGDFQLAIGASILILFLVRKVRLGIAISIALFMLAVVLSSSFEAFYSGDFAELGGSLVLTAIFATGILLFSKKSKYISILLFSILSLLILVADVMSLSSVNEGLEGVSSISYGLYLVGVADLGLIAASVVSMKKAKK